IDVLGPLGNGFPDPGRGKKAVMVAGGMGIVPMYMLAERLPSSTFLFGARSAQEAVIADDFKGLGCRIKVSTEDGSVGKKGLVTALLKEELTPRSVIYACGPAGMLKAVSKIAHEAGVRSYVSLERSMACGIGVCLGCAVKSKAHGARENRVYKMVCSDGPVFDSEDIDWELFQ
ncbi:MAG: dihydroorotate dehydrogenase electron transfer subunit, partial [Deltaproteobacteria bacterium]|nr:dihydroorotate dehydrogenase electron transfer subunit [Deltaproteobacteria bacterium]